MNLIAIPLTIVLLSIAFIHAWWATGGMWPASNEQSLARAVVGARQIKVMPPKSSSGMVACVLAVAAIFPLVLTALIPNPFPHMVVLLAIAGLALIFVLRGLAGYTEHFRRLFPEQPFASLDRRFYSPLCLAIGVAFGGLLYLGVRY